MSLLYIIGNTVIPDYAKPETFGGVQWPQPSEEVSLAGRPIANSVFPTATFTWSKLSLEGFRFWAGYVGKQYQSAEVADLILFDPQEGSNIYYPPLTPPSDEESILYPAHNRFSSGILWRIQTSDTTTEIWNGGLWLTGSIKLRISRLKE